MEHLRGVAFNVFTTDSSLTLETYILRDKIQHQFSKALYFVDTNSECLFTEKKLAAMLSSIIFSLAFFFEQ